MESKQKKCPKCNEVKPLETGFHHNRRNFDGFQSYCKPCMTASNDRYYQKNKDKMNAYRKGWRKDDRKENPAKHLLLDRERVLRRFGESPEWYDNKLSEQNGVCAICLAEGSHNHQSGKRARFAIDHNHETGKARGLLCMICNHSIHKMDKDRAWATRAVAYLERYK